MAFTWKKQIEKALKHQCYRCERKSASHNVDYLNAHANEARGFAKGNKTECMKRLQEAQEKRFKDNTPTSTLIPVRKNRN